jgi:hypothetical protein
MPLPIALYAFLTLTCYLITPILIVLAITVLIHSILSLHHHRRQRALQTESTPTTPSLSYREDIRPTQK